MENINNTDNTNIEPLSTSFQHKIYAIPEITIHYKCWLEFDKMPIVQKSKDGYDILLKAWNMEQIDYVEQVYILLLNTANRVLGVSNISIGGTREAIIDRKIIFGTALKAHASAIVIAHNHPSGRLKPSQRDINITRKIKEVGEALDIILIDHLILTSNGYYSFADEGILH